MKRANKKARQTDLAGRRAILMPIMPSVPVGGRSLLSPSDASVLVNEAQVGG